MGIGANASMGFSYKGFSGGLSLGSTYYDSAPGTGLAGVEHRVGHGYGLTVANVTYAKGGTSFYGGTPQSTGFWTVGFDDGQSKFGFTFDNDVLGDGGDRYRTSGNRITIGDDWEIGLNMFTGDPGLGKKDRNTSPFPLDHEPGTYIKGNNGENPDKYRNTISESMSASSKGSKSIYNYNNDKLKTIYDYCIQNNMKMTTNFQSLIDSIRGD